MNVVALTVGEPLQRYVINMLHERHPLRAVVWQKLPRPTAVRSLRRVYWSALSTTKLMLHRSNPVSDRRLTARRLLRVETRLRRLAQRTELGIRDDYSLASELEVTRVPELNGEDTARIIHSYEPDVLLLVGCPVIRPPVLHAPRLGALNCHTALLPHFRGSGAEHWILLTGRHECAGVSIHWATDELDAGDVTAQRQVEVRPGDNPFRLRCRSMAVAADAFAETLDQLSAGRRPGRAQPTGLPAFTAKLLTPELRWKCCLMGRG